MRLVHWRIATLATMSWCSVLGAQTQAVRPEAAVATPSILRAWPLGQDHIEIDGLLSEDAWQSMIPFRFVQQSPNPGEQSSEVTAIGVTFDESALYIGLRMRSQRPVRKAVTRRDAQALDTDWVDVLIDSYFDRRTAFQFSVNPAGVQLDAFRFSDTQQDVGWDAVWSSGTNIDADGWTAEIRIPLSQLRFKSDADRAGQTWGINVGRYLAESNERSYWQTIAVADAGFVSQFGLLTGLQGLKTSSGLEVKPYAVSTVTRAPGVAADPFFSATALTTTGGADIKYGLTSDFTINAAVNPDFGQVESDPSVVNLSTFETFLPERRPFFVEGTNLFRVTFPSWPQLFYSRRIGRAPRGAAPDSALYVQRTDASTILGAAKLTGKTSQGLSVGVLTAFTAEERVSYVSPSGGRASAVVEPGAAYTSARVMQDFRAGQSAIGAIVTSVNRFAGVDLLDLHRSAYVAGVDGRHRFAAGRYELQGSALLSTVRGSADAILRTQRSSVRYLQRPDASHLSLDSSRTSLSGTMTGVRFAKIGGSGFRWGVSGTYTSPEFEINDLGFQGEADMMTLFGNAGYHRFEPQGPLLNWNAGLWYGGNWTVGKEKRYEWIQLGGGGQFRNRLEFNVGIDRTFSSLSVTGLRGGPALRTPGLLSSWISLNTNGSKALSGGLWINGSVRDHRTGYNYSITPTMTWRPSSGATITLGPRFSRNTNEYQYVTQRNIAGESTYLFGRLEQTTAALVTRLNLSFTPKLSLELYAQPFASAGNYSRFTRVADPRGAKPEDRFERLTEHQIASVDGRLAIDLDADGLEEASFANPDFTFVQFRSNVVLRWEYRAGSTLFVVWSQERSGGNGTGTLNLRHDLRNVFEGPGTNVLAVKATFWLGM